MKTSSKIHLDTILPLLLGWCNIKFSLMSITNAKPRKKISDRHSNLTLSITLKIMKGKQRQLHRVIIFEFSPLGCSVQMALLYTLELLLQNLQSQKAMKVPQ